MTIDGEALNFGTMAFYAQIASDVRKRQLQQAHVTSIGEPFSENMDPKSTEKLSLKLHR